MNVGEFVAMLRGRGWRVAEDGRVHIDGLGAFHFLHPNRNITRGDVMDIDRFLRDKLKEPECHL